MPRTARERSNSGIYHIMLRGVNRQDIFESSSDKRRFIDTIKFYKDISQYLVYGYCLMNNHIHLLLGENGEPISDAIKRISSSYVMWYNQKYDRCGHLFQERFKSEAVENDSYFLTALRYIHQNPKKAGLVKNIASYNWSSYSEYIFTPNIVDTDFALGMFAQDKRHALKLFVEYNEKDNDDICMDYIEKSKSSDEDVIRFMKKLGYESVSQLQSAGKADRNSAIRKIKQLDGVTVRQISRITGLSKSVIDRI